MFDQNIMEIKQSMNLGSSRKIILKPVGIKVREEIEEVEDKRQQNGRPYRQQNYFINQITPSQHNLQTFQRSLCYKKSQQPKFNFIQDPRESAFSHRKFILMEKIMFIMTLFYLCLSMLKTQIDMMDDSANFSTNLSVVISICTVSLIIILFLRYVCLNQLQIDQKKFYYIRRESGFTADFIRFFSRTPAVKQFFIQFLLLLPHPLGFLEGKTVKIFQAYDQIYIQHDINDILGLISLLRIYILFRSLVNLTIYSTPRAARLCNHNGVGHNFLYSIKCLLKEEPLRTISFVFLILQITLGYGLKLSEGTLIKNMPNLQKTGFQSIINCFWCIFITMTTVGYGDYFPKTLLGRLVSFITSISGVILSSLLIVSLSAYLTMQPNESKSHLTLHRLGHQSKLQKEASDAMVETIKMTKYLSSKGKQQQKGIKSIFTALKTKIDKVKLRNRQIKSLVNNNNIMQEMNRLFELFKDNLEESFKHQIQLKKNLQQLDKRPSNRKEQSTVMLTKNMQKIIEKRM